MELVNHLARLAAKRGTWQTREQIEEFEDTIVLTVFGYMPKGKVFANGTTLENYSTGEKLIFKVKYFPSKEATGEFTEYYVIVTPSLEHGFKVEVRGSSQADMIDAVLELIQKEFTNALKQAVV